MLARVLRGGRGIAAGLLPCKCHPLSHPAPTTSACGTTSRGAPPHADLRLDQSPGAHPGRGPLRMLRRRLLLGKPRIKGHWRWTTSCPGTMAARTTSATCSPSASAATPPSDGRRAVCSAGWRAAAGCCWKTLWKLCIADAYPVTPGRNLVIPRLHGSDGLALHQPEWNAGVDAGRRSRNQIRWAGTVRWRAARRPEPAWPASDHGWPAFSARSHH